MTAFATESPQHVSKVVEITTDQHVDDLIPMAMHMHQENAAHLDFDPDVVRRYADYIIRDRGNINGWIAYKDGVPVGFLIATMHPYMFSDQKLANQELWFTVPEQRGSRVAFNLLKAFQKWAEHNGAAEIWAGVATDNRELRRSVSHVLTRMGYPKVGTYHKRIVLGDAS